jgi:hypothetical protein
VGSGNSVPPFRNYLFDNRVFTFVQNNMMMNKMKVKGILLQLKKINQGLGLLGKMIVNQNNWPSPVPVRRENPRKIKKYS